MKGIFITLEGIEGSGKSTQIRHVYDFLKQAGLRCVITREPGGTIIGRKIRSILLDPDSIHIDPVAELLLYASDRAQHIREIILPLIQAGEVVICDRYFDATLAYQGFARGLDMGFIHELHRLACRNLMPDLTILLDLPPDTGLARAWKQLETGYRPGNESRFERETFTFHERVRAGYLELAGAEPNRFRIVDASPNERQVQEQIIEVLKATPRLFSDAFLQKIRENA